MDRNEVGLQELPDQPLRNLHDCLSLFNLSVWLLFLYTCFIFFLQNDFLHGLKHGRQQLLKVMLQPL